MKNHYQSFDFLRGLGVFFVLILHTAFYFYGDIYDVDLNNPTPIITVIGFLLMFAGLFAMISGASYAVQFFQAADQQQTSKRLKHMLLGGVILLVISYVYFLFTGPGIIHFDERMMDESLLVSLINQGRFMPLSLERIFYMDSLMMLATNILLLTLFFKLTSKLILKKWFQTFVLIFALVFLAVSYVRIPLYLVYLQSVDQQQYGIMLLLNWFVGKNDPIFPFFAFALFGVWIVCLLRANDRKRMVLSMLSVGLSVLVIGVVGYILAPETMLERAIDPTWYFIIVIQIGLFILMILLGLVVLDFKPKKIGVIGRFITRFGVAGLTPFFVEQVVSAFIFFLINQITPVKFSIPGALLYGLFLALLWGFFLMLWEKKQYRFGLEWAIGKWTSLVSPSSKALKLEGKQDASHP